VSIVAGLDAKCCIKNIQATRKLRYVVVKSINTIGLIFFVIITNVAGVDVKMRSWAVIVLDWGNVGAPCGSRVASELDLVILDPEWSGSGRTGLLEL